MQMFLNRSREHTWGFVSNGYRLRILRDNSSMTRQAHLEFDLESMMEGEVYADFVLFWMICHQSRVEGPHPGEYWLERWAKAAEEQGTRALDQLRGSVERAIEALGTGFIKHPKNRDLRDKLRNGTLNKQDYYRQLLRLVYRLLLLFAAEDRELLLDPEADDGAQELYLNHYSVQRVRQVAEHFRGTTHLDQFEGLRLVMRLVGGYDNGKAKILGLPILGSALFNNAFVADIIDCKIANRDLLEAIRALAFIEDKAAETLRPIDYKHLGSEELGGIYESLLELHPEVNIDARYFRLETAGGHDRKTTGSYWTPSSLINAVLDSALEPVLTEARRAEDPEAAILNLKVCDPTCGSGSFLIAAAHRIAYALAQVRSNGDEPPPSLVRTALRQVIGRCIYGVDINPMTVELCKVNLWIEALDPGKPLSFLDHHIKVGNSLLGTTPALMAKGIPDEAFVVLEGDDRDISIVIRGQNRQERRDFEKGQRSLFELVEPPQHAVLTTIVRQMDDIDDTLISGVRAKEARWRELANDPEYINARLLADAWCAAFVWDRKPGIAVPSLTQFPYQRLCENPSAAEFEALRIYVVGLREQYSFFHWHVEFPEVFEVQENIDNADNPVTGWNGGFDCVLGNPPWDTIETKEKEFFASVSPEVVSATKTTTRKEMITRLAEIDPVIHMRFIQSVRMTEGTAHIIRASTRFSLSAIGRINTYPIFVDMSRQILASTGRVGLVVPTGIATDDNTKELFQDLVESQTLSSIYSFWEIRRFFDGTDSRIPFCLLTLAGQDRPNHEINLAFDMRSVNDIHNPEIVFSLSAQDVFLVNPNTRTCPTFNNKRDAQINRFIYQQVPVLINDQQADGNVWQVDFSQGLFNMSSDSNKFHTYTSLLRSGFELDNNRFIQSNDTFVPLYEGKMFHQFDHRYESYTPSIEIQSVSSQQKKNPHSLILPRYWVALKDVNAAAANFSERDWFLVLRRTTNSASERTLIAAIVPRIALGDKAPIIFPENFDADLVLGLVCNLNSFICDYCARQKVGGNDLGQFHLKQFPVIPPISYMQSIKTFVVQRVLELTYTAWDLQPFAQDVGYPGPPFIWDEERRFLMRCEVDALYFHLYQISRDDVDYIMETFPIVKRKDEAAHGEYRTKRVILEMYDQMVALPKTAVPAPKDETATYDVPDVSQWATWLNPGPADPAVAHREK